MDERVRRDDGVRLAAPRVQRLSAEMEREATRLLAVLLADAVARRKAGQGAVPIRAPAGGIHEPLIDQDTFDHAQALLKERGEDMTYRAAHAEFLLSGLLRCGHCRRAYVGMSAKGNGGTYHYYACSGR